MHRNVCRQRVDQKLFEWNMVDARTIYECDVMPEWAGIMQCPMVRCEKSIKAPHFFFFASVMDEFNTLNCFNFVEKGIEHHVSLTFNVGTDAKVTGSITHMVVYIVH